MKNAQFFLKDHIIECGVSDGVRSCDTSLPSTINWKSNSQHSFWPVFEANELPIKWQSQTAFMENEKYFEININKKLILIFTSSNAFYFFYKKFCNNLEDSFIFAVGEKTAHYILNLLPDRQENIYYLNGQNGLEPILNNLLQVKNYPISIFTSKIGKTDNTLKLFPEEFLKLISVHYNYTLSPLPIDSISVDIAKKLSSREPILLRCYSGQVLKQVVTCLVSFFKIKSPHFLPETIYFQTWEKSSHEVLVELQLDYKAIF